MRTIAGCKLSGNAALAPSHRPLVTRGSLSRGSLSQRVVSAASARSSNKCIPERHNTPALSCSSPLPYVFHQQASSLRGRIGSAAADSTQRGIHTHGAAIGCNGRSQAAQRHFVIVLSSRRIASVCHASASNGALHAGVAEKVKSVGGRTPKTKKVFQVCTLACHDGRPSTHIHTPQMASRPLQAMYVCMYFMWGCSAIARTVMRPL